jgi:hypothetical protein
MFKDAARGIMAGRNKNSAVVEANKSAEDDFTGFNKKNKKFVSQPKIECLDESKTRAKFPRDSGLNPTQRKQARDKEMFDSLIESCNALGVNDLAKLDLMDREALENWRRNYVYLSKANNV